MAELTVEQAVKVHEWKGRTVTRSHKGDGWWIKYPSGFQAGVSDGELIEAATDSLSQSEEVMGRVEDFMGVEFNHKTGWYTVHFSFGNGDYNHADYTPSEFVNFALSEGMTLKDMGVEG